MCVRTLFGCWISVVIIVILAHDSNTAESEDIRKDTAHKPTFSECTNYAPTVKEEQPRGTYVWTVKAQDDDPPESGGTITYSIVKRIDTGSRNYFDIDNVTGVIKTANQIDRDEPDRLKEFYITVKATDNGRPILEDICTFKITVTDVNDNFPQFDKATYDGKVSEDLKMSAEVMRVFAYDIDDGENARLTYSFAGTHGSVEYFRIDGATGVIYLSKLLTGKTGTVFDLQVMVTDNSPNAIERKTALTDVKITVIGSDKQPPSFKEYQSDLTLYENHTILDQPIIAHITAVSNIDKEGLQFELVRGLTKQTNQESTFQIKQGNDDTEADIILANQLDYEKVPDYSLTIRATNADSLAAVITINIKILDVNDEVPTYIDVVSGSVLENDGPGAEVMQVRAIDKDGTEPNNLVTYEFDPSGKDVIDKFAIDPNTGKVTTKVSFDREAEEVYYLKITAKDGAPSALSSSGEPNKVSQAFTVKIEDRNDNKPEFEKPTYFVDNVLENADIGKLVFEIKAIDKDIASLITYSIIEGNVGNAFNIEETTGRIVVNNKLDYEKIEIYNLTVKAFDGIFSAEVPVIIKIANVNDELPIFEPYKKEIYIDEERIYDNCIITLRAYDPDVKDRNADQKIDYQVGETQKEYFKVDKNGCVTVIKPLNRDLPNGYEKWQAYILAFDNNGATQDSQVTPAELTIILNDVNDNAPFLTKTEVVWYENEQPDDIIQLTAQDYDTLKYGGPPFQFKLSDEAQDDIKHKFSIDNGGLLRAEVMFDREEKKFYNIPIDIADQGTPPQIGTSILKVIIGDRNDNDAQDGTSEIFVYNYKNSFDNIQIGRVYVNDPDDWDLPDKVFQWAPDSGDHTNFELDQYTGMIIMRKGAEAGNHTLVFDVTEKVTNRVKGTVLVTIKEIPEEAVKKSGSLRLEGASIEDFIEKNTPLDMSKKDVLQKYIAKILNTSVDNVDVFTVLTSPTNDSLIDVRFSAHGSPYYAAEKLNSIASENKDSLEQQLGVKFNMVSINECLQESACLSTDSCSSILVIQESEPAVVFTNTTSFVGVKAIVERQCSCVLPEEKCYGDIIEGTVCTCPDGQDLGPHCEVLGIGFNGDGWAMYPPFQACTSGEITLEVSPVAEDGLIFYVGPPDRHPEPTVADFMSLEVRKGYLTLLVNYGTGTTKLSVLSTKISDGKSHSVKIRFTATDIEMWLDHCSESKCQDWGSPMPPNRLLNVNGPLQIGGTKGDLTDMAQFLNWKEVPTAERLQGCVRNFTFNKFTYNLGLPGNSLNAFPNCNQSGVAKAVSFSIDTNFLVAILVCIAILIILLLAVVVHRRKQDSWHEKDLDDIRETIISYEDEGGGEVDTGYDLSVLQKINDNDMPMKENLYKSSEVPDISGFLDSKKNTCDRDPNNCPFDDVRYYAYEGDGNSSGSLSSLASCTDDGDLKFNYLSSFGPRFRKLADMYGEQPSDDDSAGGGEESWC